MANDEHYCHPCKRRFTTRKALLRHVRETQNHNRHGAREAPHTCELCGTHCIRPYDLHRHKRRKHGNEEAHQNKLYSSNTLDISVLVAPPSDRKRPGIGLECHTNSLESHHDLLNGIGAWHMPSKEDIAIPTTLPMSLHPPLKRTGIVPRARPIPCGICRKPFSAGSLEALKKHLNQHFEELNGSHMCEKCQISFVHNADLQRHLISAAEGDCGFMFEHKEKCTGHHPPTQSHTAVEVAATARTRLATTDADRFDFCFRIRTWENVQLQSYRRDIHMLATDNSGRMALTDVDRARGHSPSVGCESAPVVMELDINMPQIDEVRAKLSRENQERYLRLNLEHFTQTFKHEKQLDLAKPSVDVLVRAVCAGQVEILETLISFGADLNVADGLGFHPLDYAVMCSSSSIATLLLENGALPITDLKFPIENSGSLELVRLLIEKGVPFNCSDAGRPLCSSALHAALKAQREDIVDMLLSKGADVHHIHGHHGASMDKRSQTVYLARTISEIHGDRLAIDDILCQRQAEWQSPLSLAVAYGNVELAESLLRNGASVDDNDSGAMLLLGAFWNDNDAMCKLLNSWGADARVCFCGCGTDLALVGKFMKMILDISDSNFEEDLGTLLRSRHLTTLRQNNCGVAKEAFMWRESVFKGVGTVSPSDSASAEFGGDYALSASMNSYVLGCWRFLHPSSDW